MSYSITRWNNPIIFHWHQKTVGDACMTLGKTDLPWLKHCMTEPSLPWNVIWECAWKWECITEGSRWQECVPKTREERNRSIKKQQQKSSAWGLTVVRFDWALYVPHIWRIQGLCYGRQWEARSKEQETGEVGERERRGAEVGRDKNRSQRPSIKQEKHKTQGPGRS